MNILLAVLLPLLALGGCTTASMSKLAMASGPKPEVTRTERMGSQLACVASSLTPEQKRTSFGVIDFPDKTGRINLNGGADAFGNFNTQGAMDMAMSSLMRAGVKVVDLSPAFRTLADWSLIKTSQKLVGNGQNWNVSDQGKQVSLDYMPLTNGMMAETKIGILGAITATDFLPGGGINLSVAGIGGGANKNGANTRIDVRAILMPSGNKMVGGQVIAATVVQKQIVQDGAQISISRYFGPVSGPTLISLDAGYMRREPMQLSTGAMLDLAVADLMAQIFKVRCQGLGTPLSVAQAK
jgi:hypothetical protein